MKRRCATASVLALGIGVLLSGSPAQAEERSTTQVPDGNSHCIQSSDSNAIECFSSFDTAIEAAEAHVGHTLAQQEAVYSGNVHQDESTLDDNNIIQGTFFHDEDFGGATLTIYGSGLCSGGDDTDYRIDHVHEDFRDNISSLQPWANCAIWIYSEPDQDGDYDGPFRENSAYVGDFMNDRTQSITFG